jgi:hypothetical protein
MPAAGELLSDAADSAKAANPEPAPSSHGFEGLI